jgi:hypothetical protein
LKGNYFKNEEYDEENTETKFFEGMIHPKQFKTTFLGRYFNLFFFVRLGLFEILMVSY